MASRKFSTSWWSVILVFLLISSGFHLEFADAFTDTISQGQSITTSQTIISAGGEFELGFFSPGNSTKYYVGIWYKKVSEPTIVWVANRDYSFTDPSVVLTVRTDGNLEVWEGKISYRLTSISSNSKTSATLLDSGNLVLRNNNSRILWQSFDYPSHTFLPGMKLGYDKRAGKTWSLVSWKSTEDPSPGVFSMKYDPKGSGQIFILQGSTMYWASGTWDRDGQAFSLIREMRSNDVFNFSYSFSKEQTYINYSIYNSSKICRFVLDVSGQIKQMSWLEASHQWHMFWFQPKKQCEVYAYCGPFGICHDHAVDRFCECLPGLEPGFPNNWNLNDTSGGCVRKADLQCGNSTHDNGERDQFHRVSNVRLPDYPLTLPTSGAMQCESDCLNNCSCSAYSYYMEKCTVWGGDLLNLQQLSDDNSNGQDFYLKLAASELSGKVSSSKWKVWLIVTLAISVTSAFVIWGIQRRLRRKGENLLLFDLSNSSVDTNYELSEANKLWRGEKKEVDLPMFSFVSVSAATNNFSIENKLGEGGFGPVYKGKSQKGYEVALKRLSKRSGQGWEELKNEAMLIAKLQHKNLVKLFGCCIEQDEKILIYEYMPNKSLDFFLFGL
ncbi:G-type lectin S-receptor-like serine/threonine-protein kinase At2g19130 [Vitis vinifera]|uniref:G-type lectin S-receptor-like serine/threonine-protein kinase At2g19130 n=1 Tax=Vitis vinifera TaxID=29760 RepID=UPI0008FED108|nr:G-type lectin S-receptor-like serine/threonine-protein kinase At2g19130 [Vitis vinifera]|eukprot:XP_019077973.1 PREDICTED: G-type lectin S-receptor-like serine/threonine-protein kinase At2g19130 [Vitis vinifera]